MSRCRLQQEYRIRAQRSLTNAFNVCGGDVETFRKKVGDRLNTCIDPGVYTSYPRCLKDKDPFAKLIVQPAMAAYDLKKSSWSYVNRGHKIHKLWQDKWSGCDTLASFISTLPPEIRNKFRRAAINVHKPAKLDTVPVRVLIEYDMQRRRADAILVTNLWMCVIEIKSTSEQRRTALQRDAHNKQLVETTYLAMRQASGGTKTPSSSLSSLSSPRNRDATTTTTLSVSAYLFYVKVKKRKNVEKDIGYMLEKVVLSEKYISAPICSCFEQRRFAENLRPLHDAIFETWKVTSNDA